MKRSAFLQNFSREHHAALKLAKLCERAAHTGIGLADACGRVRTAFADELEAHFAREERELIPLLDDVLKGRLLAEHRGLRDLVVALGEGDAVALRAFGELLAAHVRFEERELFEFVERHLESSGENRAWRNV